MNEPELLTVADVAKYLKVSQRTVREMIQRGDLRAAKIGKAYRIRKEDVLSLLEKLINEDSKK